MMDIRSITLEELEPFYTSFTRTIGFPPPTEAYLERERKSFRVERSVAAFDAGQVVGTTYSHLFELTLPGGAQVPAAGVTAVSTASTHRRQGILTQLMRRQHQEAAERGEAAAILVASEGRIYSRFGYGAATYVSDVQLSTKDVQMPAPNSGGRVRIVDGETADKVFPAVYDQARRARAGSIDRPEHFWESATADRDKKAIHVVFESASGEPQGYARYVVNSDWKEGLPAHKLSLHELTAVTDTAWLELWWYLVNLDLVREIDAFSYPCEDPLRWVLAEPRALRSRTTRDMYWVRPLDVARLLSTRTYAVEIDVRIEVADALLGLGGTFALSGGPSGATCTATDGPADATLTIGDLGAIVLGGTAPSELARAGRIDAGAGLLPHLDAAFIHHPRPWGNTYF
jgi:predicted acetyltransferase